MQRRTRSILAILAGVGLILSLLGFATTPANAGAYTDEAAFGTHIDNSLSGTADNGVDWSVNVGSISHGQTMTYTFSEPVLVRFSVSGLNCQGEAAYVPEPAQLETEHENHTWDESNHRLLGAGASSAAESWFVIDEPVTSYSIIGSSRSDCGRGTTGGTITAFTNEDPTIEITSPADGAEYYLDQPVDAAYSCNDVDNPASEVTCEGDVANGEAIDTATTGAHTFGVSASDVDGGTASASSAYTVKAVEGACQATAVGVGPLRLVGANTPSGDPCIDAGATVVELSIPLGVQLPPPFHVLNGSIDLDVIEVASDKDRSVHSAETTIAHAHINLPMANFSLELNDLFSSASATPSADGCDAPADLSGNAEIGDMIWNGQPQHPEEQENPGTINVPGVLSIHLNQVEKTGDSVASRVLHVDLPGDVLDVVVAESEASVRC